MTAPSAEVVEAVEVAGACEAAVGLVVAGALGRAVDFPGAAAEHVHRSAVRRRSIVRAALRRDQQHRALGPAPEQRRGQMSVVEISARAIDRRRNRTRDPMSEPVRDPDHVPRPCRPIVRASVRGKASEIVRGLAPVKV